MKIEQGTLQVYYTLRGVEISFITRDYSEIDSFFGKDNLSAVIKPYKAKRSLDANSYFWVLADKVGAKVGLSKEEVYRELIQEVGVFDDVAVADKAVEVFVKNWNGKGTGWIAEIQPDCKIPKCTKVRCYYGSSCYDSQQMGRLIDRLIIEAKEIGGIETLPPNELARLKSMWGGK